MNHINGFPTVAAGREARPKSNAGCQQVAVLVDDTGAYSRDLLMGIGRYQRENKKPWALHVIRRRRFELPPPCLQEWRGQGVIARVDTPEVERSLKALRLPVVNVSGALKKPFFPTLTQDPLLAAHLALKCFDDRSFRHHAFVGDSLQQWSLERYEQFRHLLEARGGVCGSLLLSPEASEADRAPEVIGRWLNSQPRPLGIWAGDDRVGLQVLNACLHSNIRVPEDVAVLGVDNDISLTDLAPPPLSSIILNAEGAGYRAAQTLDLWMAGEVPPMGTIQQLAPVGVAWRRSTDVFAVDDPHVASALKIIQREACDGVRVAEVVGRVPIARRQLEMRFKDVVHRTLLAEIWRVQCRRAKELLETTNLPLLDVAEQCGYRHLEHFSKVFKKVVGHPPGEHRRNWRRGHATRAMTPA
ncbi:xylose operon transcription regulator XylR [Verrucomicrobium spinosum]|uniref:AraC family transcriptional regulator n=1 Tax=Verrucomicrobium spinosum TaxID=2736 RepID=UPI0012F679E3|nr:DNA-binding transcriptional regulator [Verrucomicrobium spinosum]